MVIAIAIFEENIIFRSDLRLNLIATDKRKKKKM